MEPRERQLVVILADISGYTRFMLENQLSAVHGQLCITSLLEVLIREVDIPLQLQEIEGDALFLYAAHPGDEAGWRDVLDQVRAKLPRFFQAFIEGWVPAQEATPCGCAICRNVHELKLKVIVHVGRAVFHEIAGRPQISGADVILAHRLLKNSLPNREYLLMTEAAFRELGAGMGVEFEERIESCEGFGDVKVYVEHLDQAVAKERDAFYALPRAEFAERVRRYLGWGMSHNLQALREQWRHPAVAVGWPRRLAFVLGYLFAGPFILTWTALVQPGRLRRRHAAELRKRASATPIA